MFGKKKAFRNLTDPGKVWQLVKKDFERFPCSHSMQFANLSKEGYAELKRICADSGITVFVSWSTPDYQAYSFKK